MKSNRLLALLSFVLWWGLSAPVQAQVVRYKDAQSAKLWTAAEVDTFVQVMSRRGKSAGYEFALRITNTSTRSDTLIHEYTLTGTPTRAALSAHQQQLQALVGKPLPAFSLPDLQGQVVSTKSLLGKPVVLNLWFTACGPCLAEMPVLNRIRQEKTGTQVVFLALTFDTKEKVQAFLKKQPFAFRQIAGAKLYANQFTTGYPTSLFVDRQGIVRRVVGSLPVQYDPVTKKPLGVDDQEFYVALRLIE